MPLSDPKNPNDAGQQGVPAPSSATGIFSAVSATVQRSEPEDVFLQFHEPCDVALSTASAPQAVPPTDVQRKAPHIQEVFIKSGKDKRGAESIAALPESSGPKGPALAADALPSTQAADAFSKEGKPTEFTAAFQKVDEGSDESSSAPPPQSAGAFTRMFGIADVAASGETERPSFTPVLRGITDEKSVAPPDTAKQEPPTPKPVRIFSIAEILQRLDGPTSGSAESFGGERSTPGELASKIGSADGSPAEMAAFTQFMSGAATPQAPKSVVAATDVTHATVQSAALKPASLTELLQSLDAPADGVAGAKPEHKEQGKETAAAELSPTGFTRFFEGPLAPGKNEFPLSRSDAPAAQLPPAGQGSSFTQLMQNLNAPPPVVSPNDSLSGYQPSSVLPTSAPPHSPFGQQTPKAGPLGPGGFTQLLQTLAEPESAVPPTAVPEPMLPQNVAHGGATGIFSTPAARAPMPPPTGGPSEFTQVLSGSALRDARGESQPAAAPPPGPILPGALQMPPMAMAGMPPVAQLAPMVIPQLAGVQPPAVTAPPASPAPEKTKLQQYLPLILIANALILIVLIVIVVFVLRAHK